MFKAFEKLKLQTKLIFGFSLVVLFSIISAATSFWAFDQLGDTTKKMYEKDLLGISYLRQINRDTNIIGRVINRYVLAVNAGDSENAQKALDTVAKTKKTRWSCTIKQQQRLSAPLLKKKWMR
jgi:methyl-accepting chemotaxis protein